LKQEWQKSPALGPGKQTAKTWFGLEKYCRKKMSQIINAYFYLPFFPLIILWFGRRIH
jgi:hypothetical protein